MREVHEPIKSLAAAIVLRAIIDWVTADAWLRTHQDMTWINAKQARKNTYANYRAMLHDTECFFQSAWFTALCDIDGNEILRKLKSRTIRIAIVNNLGRTI